MTNFERIKGMSVEELAENAVTCVHISIGCKYYMSLLNTIVHDTKETAIEYNKKWLESEAEE
jgi:hypothetical protein